MDDTLWSLPHCQEWDSLYAQFELADTSAGVGLEQRDDDGTTTDDDSVRVWPRQAGEACGQGVGSEGLNFPRTYQDTNACQPPDIHELLQSDESAIVSYGGGAAAGVGAVRQGEPAQEHSAPRESANHTQEQRQERLPIPAQGQLHELRITDAMQSTFQKLRGLGWDVEMQPLDCTTAFTLTFSKREGRKRPKLTGSNILALQGLHNQGFRIILKPLSHASTQDVTERPRSGPSSQDLCSNCARRFDFEN